MKKKSWCLFASILFLLCQCSGHSEERDFFVATPNDQERIDLMKTFSLEKQYRIYRYGNDKIAPPAGVEEPITERGSSAMPFLLEKMASASDDESIMDNLWLFQLMCITKSYEVRDDSHAMDIIQQAVGRMKHKDRSLEMMRHLKQSNCQRNYNCSF